MRCTIHPTTAQDLASVVTSHDVSSPYAVESRQAWPDALLEACAASRQVWTAANAQGKPLAFIGAAPWPDNTGRGRLWFVVLAAYDGNAADLKSVIRLTLAEMLQDFAQLENHVSAEQAWALELMRDAGFTVEPALVSRDGGRRHRVWIDADTTGQPSAA